MNVTEPYFRFAPAKYAQILEVELPGVEESDISLEVRDGEIRLKARKPARHTDREKLVRQELLSEQEKIKENSAASSEDVDVFVGYATSFRLIHDAKEDNITSAFKDGILTITIPRCDTS